MADLRYTFVAIYRSLFFFKSNILLACVLITTTLARFEKVENFKDASHAVEMTNVFFGLLFISPRKYPVEKNNF